MYFNCCRCGKKYNWMTEGYTDDENQRLFCSRMCYYRQIDEETRLLPDKNCVNCGKRDSTLHDRLLQATRCKITGKVMYFFDVCRKWVQE